jgi:hypothetical protein
MLDVPAQRKSAPHREKLSVVVRGPVQRVGRPQAASDGEPLRRHDFLEFSEVLVSGSTWPIALPDAASSRCPDRLIAENWRVAGFREDWPSASRYSMRAVAQHLRINGWSRILAA